MVKAAVAVANKPAADPNKKEIVQTIRGPVVERLTKVIPQFATYSDAYETVLQNPELLHGCLLLFRQRREMFQDLLIDVAGNRVEVDDMPLRCGRTVDEIIGMVVRSGARHYADVRFGKSKPTVQVAHKAESESLIKRLSEIIGLKWGRDEQPKVNQPSDADRFYSAVKDNLENDWQVPLIPHYAELPIKLLVELGKGVTTLRTPEGIAALANVGRKSMDEARKILSNEMMREMLDTQPVAVQGIAFLGKEKYEYLHSAVYERMGENFWQMCVDVRRLEAMESKNPKELAEMASHLHIISAATIDFMCKYLKQWQISVFLAIGSETLGEEEFAQIFSVPGQIGLVKVFCEKCAAFRLSPDTEKEDFATQLPDVFRAYQRNRAGFEKGM
jgi:hypothetical protein